MNFILKGVHNTSSFASNMSIEQIAIEIAEKNDIEIIDFIEKIKKDLYMKLIPIS
jgi:hypothetical protein